MDDETIEPLPILKSRTLEFERALPRTVPKPSFLKPKQAPPPVKKPAQVSEKSSAFGTRKIEPAIPKRPATLTRKPSQSIISSDDDDSTENYSSFTGYLFK